MSQPLKQIVPWGRTSAEYAAMFTLTDADRRGRVLDCGGGPSSFTADSNANGFDAVAIDPIYDLAGSEIGTRFHAIADGMIEHIRACPKKWVWNYHRSPEDLLQARRRALDGFLADYESGRIDGRYIAGRLPELPYNDDHFDLALCSHLLFLYSEMLSEHFHVQAIHELARVAREVRIFPLLTLDGELSCHLAPVRAAVKRLGGRSEVVPVHYELQRGGNKMLIIWKN